MTTPNTKQELREKLERIVSNKYNLVYHQLSSTEQTQMWTELSPEVADEIEQLISDTVNGVLDEIGKPLSDTEFHGTDSGRVRKITEAIEQVRKGWK